jgi:hypothetical protein
MVLEPFGKGVVRKQRRPGLEELFACLTVRFGVRRNGVGRDPAILARPREAVKRASGREPPSAALDTPGPFAIA